jgi:hypothetical protein
VQVDTGRQALADCRARRQADGALGGRNGLGGADDALVDLVTVPERQGLEAVDILRLRGDCGAVLHGAPTPPLRGGERATDGVGGLGAGAGAAGSGAAGSGAAGSGAAGSTLSFLVPFGTAEAWQLPGGSCRHVRVPGPEYDWLLPPGDGLGRAALTDPSQLSAALAEAARTLAVCDGC